MFYCVKRWWVYIPGQLHNSDQICYTFRGSTFFIHHVISCCQEQAYIFGAAVQSVLQLLWTVYQEKTTLLILIVENRPLTNQSFLLQLIQNLLEVQTWP